MEIIKLIEESEKELKNIFENIDNNTYKNSEKVLNAFHEAKISESHFNSTTGYGYGDIGRDKIEEVFANILGAEDALVRNQFISGSHALTVALFALLRPNDTLLSITGLPYDTLHEVVGIKENNSSLKSFGINYEQIDLINNDFNYEQIEKILKEKNINLIEIQRSRGYSERESLVIEKLEKVIKLIKNISPNTIIMVDNCYCEFVETISPCEIGADIIVGSLIKNLGGGIAPNGAYIAGKKELVELCGERLTLPGEGKEVGPSLGINKQFLQGLYMAPTVVSSSLKTVILASLLLEKLGLNVSPKYNEKRADIVQTIIFNDSEKLIKFTEGIQFGSAIDAHVSPIPTDMPGYSEQVIMASGSFTQGSSIEISCDGPLREPFIAYLQGSLTYEYGKLALISAINNLLKS